MTKHKSNLKAFVDAAKISHDPIFKAYCGLVAVELILKDATGLKDHDVPAALRKFGHHHAIDRLLNCRIKLDSLAGQLKRKLAKIWTQDQNQTACQVPTASYPYLRYTRLAADGWSGPVTSQQEAEDLANTVQELQAYLKHKFQKSL